MGTIFELYWDGKRRKRITVKTFVPRDNIYPSGYILCFFSRNKYKLTQNGGQLSRLKDRYGGLGHFVPEMCSDSP